MNICRKLWSRALFFLIVISHASALSFKLIDIAQDGVSSLNFTGDASTSDKGLELTIMNRNDTVGRAIYKSPLHLWDQTSRNLTNFNTKFSFGIHHDCDSSMSGGLAFFLEPANTGSFFQDMSQLGGLGLGLTIPLSDISTSTNDFVAVEFDTNGSGSWEVGSGPHVGIDVNSLSSKNRTNFPDTSLIWIEHQVQINYNSSSTLLTVRFTTSNFDYGSFTYQNVEYAVDMREILPEWASVGFSASSGKNCTQRNLVSSWEFESDLPDSVNIPVPPMNTTSVPPLPSSPEPPNVSPPPNDSIPAAPSGRIRVRLIVGVVVSIISVLALSLILIWVFVIRKKGNKISDQRRQHPSVIENNLNDTRMRHVAQLAKICGPRNFSYDEIAHMTGNFSESSKLGRGGCGAVYKGICRQSDKVSIDVAVKRIFGGFDGGLQEYIAEMKIISQIRHRNLVQLIGRCHEKGELFLVYEFMPNGSLDYHLFGEKYFLSWELRYKIAKGLALALSYLHDSCNMCVLHRDIKSSNVLLDSSFSAILGDFGLARLVDHEKGCQETMRVTGTKGYMAPEYFLYGIASRGSDVYSFGIVALEIASGKRATFSDEITGDSVELVEWVWELYGMGRHLEAADQKLCSVFDEREMECLIILGLWCSHPDCDCRPSISKVINVLNFENEWPQLPLKMPRLIW